MNETAQTGSAPATPAKLSRKAYKLFVSLIRATLKPRSTQSIWDWLDNNVVVPLIAGSRYPGPLDTGIMPQWRGLLEKYADRHVHFVTICKAARIGGTLFFGICLILEKIARWPGPILWIDPTNKTAKSVSRREIEPYLLACAAVREVAILSKTAWTVLEKIFKTCTFTILGAGSITDFGGRQGEIVLINEQDRISNRSADAPTPSEEGEARSSQFEDTRKIVRNSTPFRESGLTWGEYLAGSQENCYVPCPECHGYQRLTFWKEAADPTKWMRVAADDPLFATEPIALRTSNKKTKRPADSRRAEIPDENIKPTRDGRGFLVKGIPATGRVWWPPELADKKSRRWDIDSVAREARYECAYCQHKIRPEQLAGMNDGYEWRSHNTQAPRDHVSAHLSALYSPFQSWGAIAKKFLLAIGCAHKMHAFYNLILGLPYIALETKLTKKTLELIQADSPKYDRQFPEKLDVELTLPARPVMLLIEADVQQTEFWWSIRALMVDGSRYILAWGSCGSFKELETLANRVWKYDHGADLPPETRYEEFTCRFGAIDTGYKAKRQGGVYEFLHDQGGRWIGVRGGNYSALGKEKPITETTTTFNYKGLGEVDVHVIQFNDFILKEHLYRFVMKERRQPALYLPRDLDEAFITQTTSEHLAKRRMHDGRTEDIWQVTDNIDPHLGDVLKYGEVQGFVLEPNILQKYREKQDAQRERLLASA
jgi:phage terminase large subunit GpA-like protein